MHICGFRWKTWTYQPTSSIPHGHPFPIAIDESSNCVSSSVLLVCQPLLHIQCDTHTHSRTTSRNTHTHIFVRSSSVCDIKWSSMRLVCAARVIAFLFGSVCVRESSQSLTAKLCTIHEPVCACALGDWLRICVYLLRHIGRAYREERIVFLNRLQLKIRVASCHYICEPLATCV